MYRVIDTFTVNNTTYQRGDTVHDSDEQSVSEDPHLRQFVVAVGVESSPNLPQSNT